MTAERLNGLEIEAVLLAAAQVLATGFEDETPIRDRSLKAHLVLAIDKLASQRPYRVLAATRATAIEEDR